MPINFFGNGSPVYFQDYLSPGYFRDSYSDIVTIGNLIIHVVPFSVNLSANTVLTDNIIRVVTVYDSIEENTLAIFPLAQKFAVQTQFAVNTDLQVTMTVLATATPIEILNIVLEVTDKAQMNLVTADRITLDSITADFVTFVL